MKRMNRLLPVLAPIALATLATGCNDTGPYARAYPITDRRQIIGGESALADLGDLVLENDQIRIGIPKRGNSVGPGVFGGSLIDADLQRPQPAYRAGRGLDQFTELFPVGNLSIASVCEADETKHESFCALPEGADEPRVEVLCDGLRPCTVCSGPDCAIDLREPSNADYADADDPDAAGPGAPSEQAAVVRVEAQSGNYLEALQLVDLANVKSNFIIRNDFILEPGARYARIRTLLTETRPDGTVRNPDGTAIALPALDDVKPLFGLLLGSAMFPTELPDLDPGITGGDFLFFGDRMHLFAPGVGFDVYRNIRNKFATGQDPLNNPVAADFLVGVGEHVSYAIGSPDPGGKYLLPILSGAVTAGFSHGANCSTQPCLGTPDQCRFVQDCTQARSFFFERLFAVGEGDVASAAAPIYAVRGDPTGELSGRVVDARDGRPISHADVFAYAVPETMEDCAPGGKPDAAYRGGPEGFVEQCLLARHFEGAISHMRTDKAADDLPAGAYRGVLPAGRYYLLAKTVDRPVSQVVAVTIYQQQKSKATLALSPPGKIRFEIRDGSNQRIPAKLIIGQCMPNCSGRFEAVCERDEDCPSGKCEEIASQGVSRCLVDNCPSDRACDLSRMRCVSRGSCASDSDCEPVESCVAGRCICAPSLERQAALGESAFPPGIGRYEYAPEGKGTIAIEPGHYEVWASRGFEYSVDKAQVQLMPGRTEEVALRLKRVVDTGGWVSADFHVHGQNSYDAVVKHRDRVACFAGEGVDMLSTSDHDYITDLEPYVREMGLEKWLATQVGLELTTVEIGHWLAFPLRYEEYSGGERVREQGAVDWTGKPPEQLHAEMRALGRFGPDDTVVVSAHPRDYFFGYFYQFGMSGYDPSKVEGTLFEYSDFFKNPLADPELYSGTFDALELFNSKRYEMVRTPTAGEIRDYTQARAMIQHTSKLGAMPEVIERQLIELDRDFIKDILRRTPAEQDAVWDSDGQGGCDTMSFCTADTDCEQGDGEICDPLSMACVKPCSSDADCNGAACLDGRCDPGWTPAGMPCTSYDGVVDDWFRLLDYGVVRTGLGNSDSHKLFTQTEGGLPRNFVRLDDTEGARGIDQRALARAVKQGRVVCSYGPFVELWAGEAEVGDTYSPASSSSSIPLRIRVQSPEWFDVDRVEVYRSGRLVHVFTHRGDELDADSQVDVSGLGLPNRRVVNLDARIEEPVPERDAWYVAIAMGLDGRDLSPVYTEHPYLKLQIGDILSRAFGSVPIMAALSFGSTSIPRVFRVYPYAVTNPVFVDIDGGGYDAPHPAPDWEDGAPAYTSQGAPLRSPESGPLAPPTDAREWKLRQLRYFMGLLARRAGHEF
ncbi:MAG: hypothetical protein JXR96_29330 [Deltaproteobacteria bacterium]|nr:hypothetical protein [Deltaproteobacteria bacterium]